MILTEEMADLITYAECKARVAKAENPRPAEEWMGDALSAYRKVRDTGVRWVKFARARDSWKPFPGFDMTPEEVQAALMRRSRCDDPDFHILTAEDVDPEHDPNELDLADEYDELGYDPNEDD